MDVTVVVATYGDESWVDLAYERAIPSVTALGVPVSYAHGPTLHDARNRGLASVVTEWVTFLDADDELAPGYFDAMEQGTADLRAPAVSYIEDGHAFRPKMPRVSGHQHNCTADCLEWGNWLVIGTTARAELLREVGGFRDFPIYEDYDLWARCWKAGATVEAIPAAVYRAHVRRDSRNRGPGRDVKHSTHQAIAKANGLEVPA